MSYAGAARGETNLDHPGSRWGLLAFAFSAMLAFMLAGCSSENFSPASRPTTYYAPSTQSYGTTRTEVASWYGPGFAGRPTSSGEIYNPEGLTAASKTLPLGSHVRVTNPDTGRSVVVRINDRGPYVRGRSLDLSHGAARQIGLTGKGVGRVEVTPTASSTPTEITSRTAVYSYSSLGAPVRTTRRLSYVSYSSRTTYSTRTRTRHRYHHYSSTRTVSNPIGTWLSSAFPRF